MKFPELKFLPAIWIGIVLLILLLGIIRLFYSDFETISLFSVFVHSVFVLLILASLPQQLKVILIWGFIVRILFLLWDFYAREIFILPNSGGDAGMYYGYALRVSEDISLLNQPIRGGIYSKIIGVLFYIIGPQRLFAQYLNVLVGLFVVIFIYKILNLLEIASSIQNIILFVAALFPNSLIMSAIFLREIIPTLLVTISLYHFIVWYKNENLFNILLSFIFLGYAALFHSGVIGIFIGYAFFFSFYRKTKNKFLFSTQTILAFLLVAVVVILASSQFGGALFGKFKGADEMEDIYLQANRRLGESAYLTGIQINNPAQFIMFGPVKAFYFLTSPLPMNWRGGMDIFSFTFDSTLYLLTLWFIWKNWNSLKEQKPLLTGLLIAFIGVVFIFGIGVANAGTAIRHRQKIIPLVLIILAVMMDEKQQDIYHSIKYSQQNISYG